MYNLVDALEIAVNLIEGYEADIRNSAWTGVDLVGVGFCQGTVYKEAALAARKTLDFYKLGEARWREKYE